MKTKTKLKIFAVILIAGISVAFVSSSTLFKGAFKIPLPKKTIVTTPIISQKDLCEKLSSACKKGNQQACKDKMKICPKNISQSTSPSPIQYTPSNLAISTQQYSIVDKAIADPVLSFLDEPTQLTFTLRPEYYTYIQRAEIRIFKGHGEMVTIPLTVARDKLTVTISPNQKQNLNRYNDARLLLIIDGRETWPANFNFTFEVIPFDRADLYAYESTNVTVLGPYGYEQAFRNIAQDNELCYSIARQYFGAPLPAQRLYVYISIGGRTTASSGIVDVNDSFNNSGELQNYGVSTTCAKTTLHEIIHVYLAESPFPSWMNEGLAETLSQRLTKKSPEFINDNLSCLDNYWTAYEVTTRHPYLRLDEIGVAPQDEYYYATPRCYLKYLEGRSNNGNDIEKDIIDRMFEYRNRGIRRDGWCSPGYKSYLRDILVPLFGESIVDDSVNRFGIKDYVCS